MAVRKLKPNTLDKDIKSLGLSMRLHPQNQKKVYLLNKKELVEETIEVK